MDFPISSNVKGKQLIISEGQDEVVGPEWLFPERSGKGY